MNPYSYVISGISPTVLVSLEMAALVCILQLFADAYVSGYTRGPANNEHDFVVRQIQAKFGADHIVSKRFVTLFASYLGK